MPAHLLKDRVFPVFHLHSCFIAAWLCCSAFAGASAKTLHAALNTGWACTQDVVVSERRFQYEAEVRRNPMNYDAWFDYARLEESAGDPDKVYC